MNEFTQMVLLIGRLEPQGVTMLGTGFIVRNDGLVATSRHVVGSSSSNLVVLMPHLKDINEYQYLCNTVCQTISCSIEEIDPFRDIAILKADIKFDGVLPTLSGLDKINVGDEVEILGFPHCVEGRRALTYQKTEVGSKVILANDYVKSKHAVINTQARPGQSGSVVISATDKTICGLLLGAWAPTNTGGISLGGINPRELHQTTHCVSAEYIRLMI